MTVGFLVIRKYIERIEEDISAVAVLHIFFDAFFFLSENPNFLQTFCLEKRLWDFAFCIMDIKGSVRIPFQLV